MLNKDLEQWQKISERFHALVDLPMAEQQQALVALKQEDQVIYEAVQELLAEELALHPVLRTEALQAWKITEDESLVGSQIGIYELMKHVGSGGMGSVFLAERRTEDFDQTVALKLIRPGGLDAEAVRRFKQERQILASLTHPNIARLYDGGMTEDNRHYFTMEHVEGLDLVSFLDTKQASLTERIQLFLKVAKAISYAHARLVLHLDLKPSNILVSESGEVKILDFGVAERLSEEDLSMSSTGTSGSHRYTLAYGSPEQLQGATLSTRSDIYSLGVLLYQMLVGRLPIAFEEDTSPLAYKEKVLASTIPPPSSHTHFAIPEISAGDIAGDLDTIIMTCLERETESRYGAVDQLIGDLEAYLDIRPISARTTDRWYTFQKFTRRNRSWLSVSTVALLGLALVITFYTTELRKERNEAISEAQKNEKLLDFVTNIFQAADPFYAQGDTATVYELLAQGDARLDSTFREEPELYLDMAAKLGSIYQNIGAYDRSKALATKAMAIIEEQPDLQRSRLHVQILSLLSDIETSKRNLPKAKQLIEEAIEMEKEMSSDDELMGGLLLGLGNTLIDQDSFQQADSILRQSLQYYESLGGTDKTALVDITHALGDVKRHIQEFDSSEIYYRKSLALKQQMYSPPNSEIAYTLNHLASLYRNQGMYDSALVYAKEAYRQREIVFGAAHVESIASLGNIARLYKSLGYPDSSAATTLKMDALLAEVFPEPHPYRLGVGMNVGFDYLSQKKYEDAERTFRGLVEMHNKLDEGKTKPNYVGHTAYRSYLGLSLVKQNKLGEALPLLRKAMAFGLQLGKPDAPFMADVYGYLGEGLLRHGEKQEGCEFLQKAYDIYSPEGDRYAAGLKRVEGLLAECGRM